MRVSGVAHVQGASVRDQGGYVAARVCVVLHDLWEVAFYKEERAGFVSVVDDIVFL